MTARRALLPTLVSLVGVVALLVWALDQPAPEWPAGGGALLSLAGGLAAFAAATVLRAIRWRSLARASAVPLATGEALALTVSGYALNNVLPARAGDVYRGLSVARDGVPLAAAAGTIVAERLLDAAALGAFLFVALLVGPSGARLPDGFDGLAVVAVCVAGVALAGLVAALWERPRVFLRTLLWSLARIGPRTVTLTLLASIALWGLEALVYLLAADAVGVPTDPLGAIYVLAIANLVGVLPAAPSAVGTYDVAVVFAARAVGAAADAALSYVLALRAVLFLPITVLGIVVLVVRRRRAGGARTPVAQADAPAPVAPVEARGALVAPVDAGAPAALVAPADAGAMAEPVASAPLVVVMPALDEAATIGDLLAQVRTTILDRVDGARAVIVDDGSRDATGRLLDEIAARDPRVTVLHGDAPTGQGPATRRAIESRAAAWYLQLDADGQVDVADFPRLWALRDDADLVLGVRRRRRDPLHRMAITTATRGLVRRVAGRPLHDAATPLRLIRGELWDDLRPLVGPRAMSFSVLVSVAAVRRGWRVRELDVAHHARRAGRSRLRGLRMASMLARGVLELRELARATAGGRDDGAAR